MVQKRPYCGIAELNLPINHFFISEHKGRESFGNFERIRAAIFQKSVLYLTHTRSNHLFLTLHHS